VKALFYTFLWFVFASSALTGEPIDRAQANRDAHKQFLSLNFFANGRGMHLSPGLIDYYNKAMERLPSPGNRSLDLRTWFTRRWGMQVEGKDVVGLFTREYRGQNIGVVGCVACHSGRAAGQLVVGLGNKNIDVVRMARDVRKLELWWKALVPKRKKNGDYLDLEEDALAFAEYLGDERIGNLTQGLVPVSFIRGWFYRVQGEEVPADMRRGQIKVPFLWGYEEKRKVGLFCDGYGEGSEVGWAAAVELAAGQSADVVRDYYPKIREAEEVFNHFLPPIYPFAISKSKATRGKAIFSKNCAGCHGTYENDIAGFPVFQAPKFIPWAVVRTDDDRILGNTPAFSEMVNRSPLRDLISHTNLGPGYFAPRLEGVWSRFPYLHNGSVPNVKALLTKPSLRPIAFSLKDAGELKRFDMNLLGLTNAGSKAKEKFYAWQAKVGKRSVYSVEMEGHSNQGHDFHTNMSEADKGAVIEYLKTL